MRLLVALEVGDGEPGSGQRVVDGVHHAAVRLELGGDGEVAGRGALEVVEGRQGRPVAAKHGVAALLHEDPDGAGRAVRVVLEVRRERLPRGASPPEKWVQQRLGTWCPVLHGGWLIGTVLVVTYYNT